MNVWQLIQGLFISRLLISSWIIHSHSNTFPSTRKKKNVANENLKSKKPIHLLTCVYKDIVRRLRVRFEVSVCLCEHTTRKIMLKEMEYMWKYKRVKTSWYLMEKGKKALGIHLYISRRVENNRLRQLWELVFSVVGQSLHKVCKTHRK